VAKLVKDNEKLLIQYEFWGVLLEMCFGLHTENSVNKNKEG